MSNHSLRILLLPFTPLYRLGLNVRETSLSSGREAIRRLKAPVISVGNLSTGGTGKTPFVIALAQALTRRAVYVDVLSRGYGRAGKAPARVDPRGTAQDFGDEPLVIAREAGVPVYVAAERFEAGQLAESEGGASTPESSDADTLSNQAPSAAPLRVHLLDDGYQHRQLARDIDILLLNRRDWRDHLLPAGNLREPRKALFRAHVVAIPAEEPELETELKRYGWKGPIWRLHRQMQVPPIAGPVIAFCGIAHSQQFFAGLESAGLHLASRIAFADHHPYAAHDVDCLLDAARTIGPAALVTTAKDRARLGGLIQRIPQSLPLKIANLHIAIEDEAARIEWLMGRLTPPAKLP